LNKSSANDWRQKPESRPRRRSQRSTQLSSKKCAASKPRRKSRLVLRGKLQRKLLLSASKAPVRMMTATSLMRTKMAMRTLSDLLNTIRS
jgi:hypothetical protein